MGSYPGYNALVMREELLFGTRGPWPQPSPIYPDELAPAVVHVPLLEQADFAVHVLSRLYLSNFAFRPVAAWYALTHPGLDTIDDAEFGWILTETANGKFLNRKLDPPDLEAFAPFLAGLAGEPYKMDFSAMGLFEPMAGTYFAPTVTLFERDAEGHFRVLAIRINDLILTPADGPAWDLAKYFVLQGTANHLSLGFHAWLHFPMDSVNAITKTILPRRHLVFQLLHPHFRFSLALDDGVLHHPRTLLHNSPAEVFTPFASSGFDLPRIVSAGLPGNSSYPRYRFRPGPPPIPTRYGEFLTRYYDVIRAFVGRVTADIPPDDPDVKRWADHAAKWMPGFPDAGKIQYPGMLADVVATIILGASVGHAADHESFGGISPAKLPFRLRLPPPTSREMAPFDRRDLASFDDLFRSKMANEMFFKPSNVTLLGETRYDFADPALREENTRFLRRLHLLDADPTRPPFVALARISASIQY